jgi:hypothetical protein
VRCLLHPPASHRRSCGRSESCPSI